MGPFLSPLALARETSAERHFFRGLPAPTAHPIRLCVNHYGLPGLWGALCFVPAASSPNRDANSPFGEVTVSGARCRSAGARAKSPCRRRGRSSARRLQVKHFERRNFGERKASGWLDVSGTALAGFTQACWKSSCRAPLPDWQINEVRHSFGLANSAPSSLRYDNPALGAAWRQRQANMHRQSMWRSVFRRDCPAYGLDVAACDR